MIKLEKNEGRVIGLYLEIHYEKDDGIVENITVPFNEYYDTDLGDIIETR